MSRAPGRRFGRRWSGLRTRERATPTWSATSGGSQPTASGGHSGEEHQVDQADGEGSGFHRLPRAPISTTSPEGSIREGFIPTRSCPMAHEASSPRWHPLPLDAAAATLSAWPAPPWRSSAIYPSVTCSPTCHLPNSGPAPSFPMRFGFPLFTISYTFLVPAPVWK